MYRLIATGILLGLTLHALSRNRSKTRRIVSPLKVRAKDNHGSGEFGASRSSGTRKHKGIDLVVKPNQRVYSPIQGRLERYSMPYQNDSRYSGVVIRGRGVDRDKMVKIFYVKPAVTQGESLEAGQFIGFAQDISLKYPGMTKHIHLELYVDGDLVDPRVLFSSLG